MKTNTKTNQTIEKNLRDIGIALLIMILLATAFSTCNDEAELQTAEFYEIELNEAQLQEMQSYHSEMGHSVSVY